MEKAHKKGLIMIIDTHCHINLIAKKTFNTPLSELDMQQAKTVIESAKANNIVAIVNVGTNYIESENCILLAKKYPECYAAVGIHPEDASDSWHHELQKIEEHFLCNKEQNKIVAIGEIGIDLYHRTDTKKIQIDIFKANIELSLKHNLPIIIHSRNAYQETLQTIESYRNDIRKCVFHCFSYDQAFADTVISWGYVLGIPATITYPKNSELQNIVKNISLSDFVLETDAPFLPPQAFRGKQNTPSYIIATAQKIAELKNVSFETITNNTTINAKKLFNI
jgi:TatD DNase family protein